MLTLNANAYISAQNTVLTIPINGVVPEGEYEILVVLQAKKLKQRKKISFSNYNIVIPKGETFRREDFYEEDGR